MNYPSTQKIVDYIVNNYRKAGKAMAKAASRNGALASWMSQDSFDETANNIEAAYNEGKFEDVDSSTLEKLFTKYGASDIYHLVASYFNSTGKILRLA